MSAELFAKRYSIYLGKPKTLFPEVRKRLKGRIGGLSHSGALDFSFY